MPASTTITVRLDPEVEAQLRAIRDELVPALEAAGQLAQEVDELLAFVPPEVNPIVLVRSHLAAIQAARDNFTQAAGHLLEVEVPDAT